MGGIVIKEIVYHDHGISNALGRKGVERPVPGDNEVLARVHAASANASLQRTARIAGCLYLLLAICFLFSTMYVDSKLYVSGDAVATMKNIQANEWLFRVGIVSLLVGQVSFLLLANELYKLFYSVNRDQARLMLILVVAVVALGCLNLANKCIPLILLGNTGYLSAIGQAQLDALAMLFLDIYQYGIYIGDIFWGLWLIPLGWLVFKSGFLPRVLGVLLLIGSIGYPLVSLRNLLLPANEAIATASPVFLMISEIVEFAFVFWLLLKGINLGREVSPGVSPQ